MSDPAQLGQLLAVSRVHYDRRRQAFLRIVREEAALREQLAALDARKREGARGAARDVAMTFVGADLLWQGWLGRAKTRLNMRLAQVLAIKEHEQKRVKAAFGKVSALQTLIAEDAARKRKTAEATALDRAIDAALQGGGRRP